jgi:hypothetical protein
MATPSLRKWKLDDRSMTSFDNSAPRPAMNADQRRRAFIDTFMTLRAIFYPFEPGSQTFQV